MTDTRTTPAAAPSASAVHAADRSAPADGQWESGGARLWRSLRRIVAAPPAAQEEPSTRLTLLQWLYLLSAITNTGSFVWLLLVVSGVVAPPDAMTHMDDALRDRPETFLWRLGVSTSIWFTWHALRQRRRGAAVMASIPLVVPLVQGAATGDITWGMVAFGAVGLSWIASVWRELR